jgi:hypothetical protein
MTDIGMGISDIVTFKNHASSRSSNRLRQELDS